MLHSPDFYIDLGTANTLFYTAKHGIVLNEPSVLALKEGRYRSKIQAVGETAKSMLGKNPKGLTVIRPLREGVIADFDNTARMLAGFVKQLKKQVLWLKPRIIISLPYQVTYHEKQAVKEIAMSLGAGKIQLMHEPVAAAIGASLPVLESQGSMVVDIGGGTCNNNSTLPLAVRLLNASKLQLPM